MDTSDKVVAAQRLQQKLRRYLSLVEQVSAMEKDPELSSALGLNSSTLKSNLPKYKLGPASR